MQVYLIRASFRLNTILIGLDKCCKFHTKKKCTTCLSNRCEVYDIHSFKVRVKTKHILEQLNKFKRLARITLF
ncbi:unnamed protein product [Paramecium octaurelia]|uniref:Uncharacterized protein n=1 Tax=Paramecium octaurelia TaxID=43137 RepID=A0A8S1WRL1_PAROT|nr:unnamed protein product [Paramecium octaurelia]